MITYLEKSRSPFYPGQPVPIELFIGRQKEIERIEQALVQTKQGKMQVLFISGEYGIGKSSLANYSKFAAERNYNILGIHVFLGNSNTIEALAPKTVEGIILTAEEIGRRFIDVQVLKAIHSRDYKSILRKIVQKPNKRFSKKEIEKNLSTKERDKFNNFLQRMEKLKAIKSLERGNYEFINPMIPLYLYLNNIKQTKTHKI